MMVIKNGLEVLIIFIFRSCSFCDNYVLLNVLNNFNLFFLILSLKVLSFIVKRTILTYFLNFFIL